MGDWLMAQVTPFQKKPGMTETFLPTALSVVGGIYGGPAGAAAGGIAGGKLAGGDKPAASPIESRMQATAPAPAAASNPSQDLANADAALAQMPPAQQRQYGAIIGRARALDSQQGKLGDFPQGQTRSY